MNADLLGERIWSPESSEVLRYVDCRRGQCAETTLIESPSPLHDAVCTKPEHDLQGPSDKSDQAVIEWVKTMGMIFLGLFLICSTIPLLQTASFSKRTILGLTALKMRQNVLTVVCQKLPVALRMRPTLVFLQFHIMRLWSASGHPRFIATAEPSNDHKFKSRARRGLLYFSNFGFNA